MKKDVPFSGLDVGNTSKIVHLVRQICKKTRWISINDIEEISRDALENPDDWILNDASGKGFIDGGIPVDFLVAFIAQVMGGLVLMGNKKFSKQEVENQIKKILKISVSRKNRQQISVLLKNYNVDEIIVEIVNRKSEDK
jgi:hypothetical protein